MHCLFQTLEFQLHIHIYIYHVAWHGGLFLFIYCMEGTVVFICVFHFVIFFYLHCSSLCSCFNSEYSKIAILTFFTSSIIYALLKFRFWYFWYFSGLWVMFHCVFVHLVSFSWMLNTIILYCLVPTFCFPSLMGAGLCSGRLLSYLQIIIILSRPLLKLC